MWKRASIPVSYLPHIFVDLLPFLFHVFIVHVHIPGTFTYFFLDYCHFSNYVTTVVILTVHSLPLPLPFFLPEYMKPLIQNQLMFQFQSVIPLSSWRPEIVVYVHWGHLVYRRRRWCSSGITNILSINKCKSISHKNPLTPINWTNNGRMLKMFTFSFFLFNNRVALDDGQHRNLLYSLVEMTSNIFLFHVEPSNCFWIFWLSHISRRHKTSLSSHKSGIFDKAHLARKCACK